MKFTDASYRPKSNNSRANYTFYATELKLKRRLVKVSAVKRVRSRIRDAEREYHEKHHDRDSNVKTFALPFT